MTCRKARKLLPIASFGFAAGFANRRLVRFGRFTLSLLNLFQSLRPDFGKRWNGPDERARGCTHECAGHRGRRRPRLPLPAGFVNRSLQLGFLFHYLTAIHYSARHERLLITWTLGTTLVIAWSESPRVLRRFLQSPSSLTQSDGKDILSVTMVRTQSIRAHIQENLLSQRTLAELAASNKYSLIQIFAITSLQWLAFNYFKSSSPVRLPFSSQTNGVLHFFVLKTVRKFI